MGDIDDRGRKLCFRNTYNISGLSDWERADFSAYPDSCTGWCAGICSQYFRGELLYFLFAGGGREAFFRRASVFCGINLALRGVSRWYWECYSEQSDILQEGRTVRRIEERAAAVPYASYEKTAFLNRLEYLANNASATYEKIMGNIGNTVRLASALIAVLTYLATLDPVLFAVAIAPFLLTLVLRRQGAVRHDYEVEKSVNDRKKAYVWRKSEKCRMTKSRNPGQQAAGRFLKFRWSMSILDTGRKRFCRISVFGGTKTEDCAGARLLLQYGIFDCR